MNRGLIGLFFGASLALLGSQASAEGPVHAVPPGSQHAACSHCHEAPHGRDSVDKARFDACESCHDEQHFKPSTFDLGRHATLSFALQGKHADVPCEQCHFEPALTGLPTECAGCHIDRHRGVLGQECTDCHQVTGFTPVANFDHGRTGFSLSGPHAAAPCESCHEGAIAEKIRGGAGATCQTCHEAGHADFGKPCESCHTVKAGRSFASARSHMDFDHRSTGFDLDRRHASQPCKSCHTRGKPKPNTRCASCHLTPHAGQLGGRCEDCHRADRWTLVRFDHDVTSFALKGSHFVAACTDCHTAQRWVGLPTACWDCHAQDAARAPRTVDAHQFGRIDCADCHTAWRWTF